MGEYFCEREYCRICLKQNYDFNLFEILGKNDWICPFCQGICFCTRCLRNILLTKLKGMYIFYGGNCSEISNESLFEKYIIAHEEAFQSKPLRTANVLKKNNLLNLIILNFFKNILLSHEKAQLEKEKILLLKAKMREYKRKRKDYQKIKNFRTNMEKVRLLSSQIIRREKNKMKLFLENEKMFELAFNEKIIPEKNQNLKRKASDKLSLNPIKKIKVESNINGITNKMHQKKNKKLISKKSNEKLKRKIKVKKQKLLRLIRKTTNSIIHPMKKSEENPNEPMDLKEIKPKLLKSELKGLVGTQNTTQLMMFKEITRRSAINKKVLRSRNLKGKLRSNPFYRCLD